MEAAREARSTGVGKKLEYRIRHKNGQWLVLESIAGTIRAAGAEHLVLGTDRDWLIDIVKFVAGRRSMRGSRRAEHVGKARRPNLTAVAAVPERSMT